MNKHEDIQLSFFTTKSGRGSDVRNEGQATIKGIEVEDLLQASENFPIRANLGLLDPEYDEFIEFGMQ